MSIENSKSDLDEKPKYPKSIAFIVSNEFCERFNYYGMRTILVLYMTIILGYNDNTAVVLFHVFTSLVYFFPVLGAIIADSYLGKYRTILYLSCVYAVGSMMIAIGAIPTLNLPAQTMTVLGLLLIGLGSGGIKPCVAAFGGDQFKIPEQAKQLATFFSLFYFSINAGSLISTYLMPVLRGDVHCFGEFSCFSLAFGVPGVLMFISIFIFVCGKSLYVIKKPTGNVIVEVTKCIYHALCEKSKSKQRQVSHWLEYAEPKYNRKLITDIQSVLKILTLFLLLPFFWALFDQQGSRWTFQATRMNGDIGFTEIKPDQMQLINPLLILVFIPLFDCAVYPILSKFGLRRPLQKLTTGGILAGIAFLISGFVELQLEKTYPVFPSPNESQMRIFNGVPCLFEVQNFKGSAAQNQLAPMNVFKYSQAVNESTSKYVVFSTATRGCTSLTNDLKIAAGSSNSFFITGNPSAPEIQSFEDKIEKSKSGNPNARVLANVNDVKEIRFLNVESSISKVISPHSIDQFEILPGSYFVFADDIKISKVNMLLGGVYTIVISHSSNGSLELENHEITSPNSVHMCWLIPQYVVMTAAEVMFSVTGLEFAYSQAPASMKSLLQASWLLTVAFGNVIVVIIAEAKFFQSQAHEFFLFAVMMFIDMALFALLAMRYKYVNIEKGDDVENAIPIEDAPRKTFTNNAFQED